MSILIKGIPLGGYEISIMKDGERYRARVDGIWCEVEEIPTTEPDTDTISRQAAIDGKICIRRSNGVEIYDDYVVPVEYLEQLPPAQPKRGKWIDKGITGDWQYQTDGRGRSWHEWQCDQCKDMVKKRSFYCPNCGADMEVTT